MDAGEFVDRGGQGEFLRDINCSETIHCRRPETGLSRLLALTPQLVKLIAQRPDINPNYLKMDNST